MPDVGLGPQELVGQDTDMREPRSGLAPWDWSESEVVVFGGPGQQISHTIGGAVQRHVTTELRAMYDDFVQQPLPEHLLELLAKLDRS